jgi:hypothetical protein
MIAFEVIFVAFAPCSYREHSVKLFLTLHALQIPSDISFDEPLWVHAFYPLHYGIKVLFY